MASDVGDDFGELLCQNSDMKTPDNSQEPTKDAIQAARMAGFKAGIRYLSPTKQDRMLKNYQVSHARLEAKLERLFSLLGRTGD